MPPNNLDAEQSVLGAILLDNEAMSRATDVISADDFYKTIHREVFAAMADMGARSEAIDIVSLPNELKKHGSEVSVAYLSTLVNTVPNAANIRHHANIVRETAILRNGIALATDLIEIAHSAPDIQEFREKAGQAFFALADDRTTPNFLPAQGLVAGVCESVEARHGKGGAITGVATGFNYIDNVTAGLQPCDLIIIAGRPSMGKTAIALNIAAYAAGNGGGLPVGIFSLEMARGQLIERLICADGWVENQHVRTGRLSEVEWDKFFKSAGHVSELPIFINDSSTIRLSEIAVKAKRLKREHGLRLLILDYLGFIRTDKNNTKRRRDEEVGDITKGLKALAKELGVPVILLCQLNRNVEARSDKVPMLSDLRESGDIEQDADLILFLHRDEVYNPCSCPATMDCSCGRRGKAKVIVAKQRNGPAGMHIPLAFAGEYMRFVDMEGAL